MTSRSPSPAQAEDGLEDRAVEPGGRAGVPGPAAAADVGRAAVDVAGDDVGLDLVALDALRDPGRGGSGSRDRRSSTASAALAELRRTPGRPRWPRGCTGRRSRGCRQVALDVAGVERLVVERRGEQEDQPPVAVDQVFVDGLQRPAGPRRIAGAGEHGPRLRDRVDPAGDVLRRAQRGAVVEVGAAVPVAVPGVGLDGRAERLGPSPQGGCAFGVAARRGDRGEPAQAGDREPGQPDALALAPGCRRGSCRRSSRPCPSAAGRGHRRPGGRRDRGPEGNARRACPAARRQPAGRSRPPGRASSRRAWR